MVLGQGRRRHRALAVRNPSPILQAEKTVTCTAGLPVHIPPSPFAPACWVRGREENQLSGEHLVPETALCSHRCCTAPRQPRAGSRLLSAAMQAASLGWMESSCLPHPSVTGGHHSCWSPPGEAGGLSWGRGSVWERVALSCCPESGSRSCCIIVWSNRFFLANNNRKINPSVTASRAEKRHWQDCSQGRGDVVLPVIYHPEHGFFHSLILFCLFLWHISETLLSSPSLCL